MKWKGFQRDGVLLAHSIPSLDTLETNYSEDSKRHNLTELDPVTQLTTDISSTLNLGDPLAPDITADYFKPQLISENIEALLEEDDRRRSQEKESEESSRSKDRAFNSTEGALVGLPAPPRGPRKTVARERGQLARSRDEKQNGQLLQLSSSSLTGKQMDLDRTTVKSLPTVADAATREGTAIKPRPILNQDDSDILQNNKISKRASTPEALSFSEQNITTVLVDTPTLVPRDSRSKSPMRQPTRPLLSHVHTSSRDSDYSHSSFSSHDPPSTAYEPRISISSTIYPSSACESLPAPPLRIIPSQDARLSLDFSESDSLSFEIQSRTGGIVDLTSPIIPEPEYLPAPQFANPEEMSSTESSPVLVNAPIDIDIYNLPSSSRIEQRRSSPGVKPSVPTAPKPKFPRSQFVQPISTAVRGSRNSSPLASPKLPGLKSYNPFTSLTNSDSSSHASLPPTTNFLNPQERAELVRKSRKLTQVLGQTPSPVSGPEEVLDSPVLHNCLLPMVSSRRAHARGALSVSDALHFSTMGKALREQYAASMALESESKLSSPLSPITFRSSVYAQDDESEDASSTYDSPSAPTPPSLGYENTDRSSPNPAIISASDSFMELADPDHLSIASSPSVYSLTESVAANRKVENERRRKREKLAKLHRFLGSRVPPEVVLGSQYEMGVPLPAVRTVDQPGPFSISDDEPSASTLPWVRSRRHNSITLSSFTHRISDSERIKEDLNDKEKAINVKRALKMEKMFGEQPPQNLYHTRTSVSLGHSTQRAANRSSSAPTSPVGRNTNKSAYRKGKYAKYSSKDRPGTAESRKGLLGSNDNGTFDYGTSRPDNEEMSEVYVHYRHSLISLTNIVDNDDRRSLVELHEYINSGSSKTKARRDRRTEENDNVSMASRTERRHSLPLQPSYSSLASEFTVTEAKVERTPFEVRRRRAAKLSHFFGVSYRNLFGEVLDSLEMGVREDEGRGTLNTEEAKDLIAQLTQLKNRRDEFS